MQGAAGSLLAYGVSHYLSGVCCLFGWVPVPANAMCVMEHTTSRELDALIYLSAPRMRHSRSRWVSPARSVCCSWKMCARTSHSPCTDEHRGLKKRARRDGPGIAPHPDLRSLPTREGWPQPVDSVGAILLHGAAHDHIPPSRMSRDPVIRKASSMSLSVSGCNSGAMTPACNFAWQFRQTGAHFFASLINSLTERVRASSNSFSAGTIW